MRIFLSYGHDEYTSLALRLKHDLEMQGHEVWFDIERLRPGGDWERYIEEGFDWSSAVPGEGRFLLLLTPHSVRRPDGYCLNELAKALSRNMLVIPLLLSTVEPPLSISRLQWLDMRDCFPAEEHEVKYAKLFEQLEKVLIEKQVPLEGVHQRLVNYLNPVSCDEDLTKHLLRFTGREWVMREVDAWLTSSRRMLWITGEAGVGKSALAAWLCDKRPEVAACHFCRFGNMDRVDARRALCSLAYQLSTQLPVYRDRLNASPLERTVIETSVGTVFDRLFVSLLADKAVTTDKPQVLLIDALDEATSSGRNELASLIGDGFDRLPPWLRVIVTSRPHEQEVNFALQALDPWKLDAGRAENLSDIQEYLYRELPPFTGGGAPPTEIVNAIVERSEGLFLYVSWFRQELHDGRLLLEHPEAFPRGLGGVYADFFKRYFPDLHEYESDCRPALEAICAAREPLEHRDLVGLLGWTEYKMRSLASQLGSLFPELDGRVRPFHQSVRDWLTDSNRAGPYWIDVSRQEQRLADFALREYKNGVNTMGHYCIKYAPFHLAACHRSRELRELLLDSTWTEAKLRVAGISGLLADYDFAKDIYSPNDSRGPGNAGEREDAKARALDLVQSAIRLSAHVIAKDPAQFAPQIVGRLLPFEDIVEIKQFTAGLKNPSTSAQLLPISESLPSPGKGEVRTLMGHSGAVTAISVSKDGTVMVSSSNDCSIIVWNLETGSELYRLSTHQSPVLDVAISERGIIVAACEDGVLRLFDINQREQIGTLTGHIGKVSAVVTTSWEHAISGSHDRTVRIWDLATQECENILSGHELPIADIALAGRNRVASLDTSTLKIWDLDEGRMVHSIPGQYGALAEAQCTKVAVTPDGSTAVVSLGHDGVMFVDLRTGRILDNLHERILNNHHHSHQWINSFAMFQDGRRAVVSFCQQLKRIRNFILG
jgi:WD40 repeat protein